MKYIIASLIISCLFCCSCSNSNTSNENIIKQNKLPIKKYIIRDGVEKTTFYVVEIEGHKYIKTSKNLLHAESCECLNKN